METERQKKLKKQDLEDNFLEENYKLIKTRNVMILAAITLNIKVMEIKTKLYQLKSILM